MKKIYSGLILCLCIIAWVKPCLSQTINPYTVSITQTNDTLIFKNLAWDNSNPDIYSTLDILKITYTDPYSFEEITLSETTVYDNGTPYENIFAEGVNLAETTQEHLFTYNNITWKTKPELYNKEIKINFYCTWNTSGQNIENIDSTSYNPLVKTYFIKSEDIKIEDFPNPFSAEISQTNDIITFKNLAWDNSDSNIYSYLEALRITYINPLNNEEILLIKTKYDNGTAYEETLNENISLAETTQENQLTYCNINWKIDYNLFEKDIKINFYPTWNTSVGSSDLKDSISYNPLIKTYLVKSADIKIEDFPNPFSAEISQTNDIITFKNLAWDNSDSNIYSYLEALRITYINPLNNEEILLIKTKYDNGTAYEETLNENISLAETTQENQLTYSNINWKVNYDLSKKEIKINFYPTWNTSVGSSDLKDSISYNPLVKTYLIKGIIPPINFKDYKNPFTVDIYQENDTLVFLALINDSSLDEIYSTIRNLKIYYSDDKSETKHLLSDMLIGHDDFYYYDNFTDKEINPNNIIEKGDYTYLQLKFKDDKKIFSEKINFHFFPKWILTGRYSSAEDSLTYNPLIKSYLFNKIEIIKPQEIYANNKFNIRVNSSEEIVSYEWKIEGLNINSGAKPSFIIENPGIYDLSLRIKSNLFDKHILLPKYIEVKDEVKINITDNFTKTSIPAIKQYSFKLSDIKNSEGLIFHSDDLPEGASLNEHTGIFTYNTPRDSIQKFNIHVFQNNEEIFSKEYILRIDKIEKIETFFEIENNLEEAFGNVKIKLKNLFDDKIEEITTDDKGKASILLNKYQKYSIAYYPDNIENNETVSIITSKTIHKTFSTTYLNLQGVLLYADEISIEDEKYILKGNVNIDSVLYFLGNPSKIILDNSSNNLASFTTKNQLKCKNFENGDIADSTTKDRTYYLYNGILIPTKNEIFNLGKIAKIDFDAYMMSFYHNDESHGVEFAVYPRLPWIIGDKISEAGYYVRDMALKLFKKGNLDIETVAVKSKYLGSIYVSQDSSMINLLEKLDSSPISLPSIKSIKRFDINEGESESVSIENINVCGKGFGLQGVSFEYDNNISLGIKTWSGSCFVKWGGKCDGSEFKRDTLLPSRSIGDVKESIESSLGDYPDIGNVTIQIEDSENQIIYESSYGEFIDISDDIAQETIYTRGLKSRGIGLELSIKDGKLDLIKISADVSFQLGAFTVTNINGEVSGLTDDKSGKVKYSTKNMKVVFGCSMSMPSGKLIGFTDLKAVVKPWNYYSFNGNMEVAEKKLIKASILWDNKSKYFNLSGSLYPKTTKGLFKGTADVSVKKGKLTGNAWCSVKLPDELPTGFGWAEDMPIGSAHVGFNSKMMGARVTIGHNVTTYEKVKETRGWKSRMRRKLKRARAKAAKAALKTVRYVKKKVQKMLTFNVAVAYNFKKKDFSFGKNVKIPQVTRRNLRGDSLIEEFAISQDTKIMYVTSTNESNKLLDFDLYDPNNNKITDDAVWCRDSINNEITAIVMYPQQGIWKTKLASLGAVGLKMRTMFMNNTAQGTFEMPMQTDTTSTQILVKFNDTQDTLQVGLFIDNNKKGHNGNLIKEVSILNNASIKFNYEPKGLLPGEYFIYYSLSDKSGIPAFEYAKGSLVILPNADLNIPLNVKTNITDNRCTISWDDVVSNDVDYVSVKLTDISNGKEFTVDISDSTDAVFNELKYSHKYTYSVYNSSFENGYSKDITGVFTILSEGNNKPIWSMKRNKVYEVFEADSLNINLNVMDPEADNINITCTELPKDSYIKDNIFTWIPEVGSLGKYNLVFEANDGELTSSTTIDIDVKTQYHKEASILFGSRKLYEQDNMFLIMNNPESDKKTDTAWLYNISKEDSVKVDLIRRSDKMYKGLFQLSFQRRSILPVSQGDTLMACYYTARDTAYAIAIFDSIPQVSDNIAPARIQNLRSKQIGHNIKLDFTVPVDLINNNTEGNPWYYDLRYSSDKINTDSIYLRSVTLTREGVGTFNTMDSLSLDISELKDINNSHRVWFNLKTGDSKFNYSEISNSVYIDYILEPTEMIASTDNKTSIELNWKGSTKLENDDFFEYHKLFRKTNSTEYELIAKTEDLFYEDMIDANFTDGIIIYKLISVYSTGETEAIFSNNIEIDRLSDISIMYNTNSELNNIDFEIRTVDGDFIRNGNLANNTSFDLSNILNDEYIISFTRNNIEYHRDTISVNNVDISFTFNIVGPTEIDDIISNNISIFPNPAIDILYINLGKNTNIYDLGILNTEGKLFLLEKKNNGSLISINISSLKSGVYFLIYTINGKNITSKFIKQ